MLERLGWIDGTPPEVERIIALNYRRCFATCYNELKNTALAQEATQETFLRLMRDYKKIRGNPSVWLRICARCVARNLRKAEFARYRRERNARSAQCIEARMQDDRLAERKQLSDVLLESMNGLSFKDRSLLIQYYYSKRTLVGLADEAGCSYQAVHKRLKRVLMQLRKTIKSSMFAEHLSLVSET